MARTAYDAARDEWETRMTKTYGSLIVDAGKNAAVRFFLRGRRTASSDEIEETSSPIGLFEFDILLPKRSGAAKSREIMPSRGSVAA